MLPTRLPPTNTKDYPAPTARLLLCDFIHHWFMEDLEVPASKGLELENWLVDIYSNWTLTRGIYNRY